MQLDGDLQRGTLFTEQLFFLELFFRQNNFLIQLITSPLLCLCQCNANSGDVAHELWNYNSKDFS